MTSSYIYKRAMPQQEKGGKTWRVAVNVIKRPNRPATRINYVTRLPNEVRAKRIAAILNACL